MVRRVIGAAVGLALAVALVAAVVRGVRVEHLGPGAIRGGALPPAIVAERALSDAEAALAFGLERNGAILFGDLHVHTGFSLDSLGGPGGTHPPADACDYARYCSGLDFFALTDHAESLSAAHWREARESLADCEARAGSADPPDLIPFLGWEWTQLGDSPDTHFGARSVVLRGLEADAAPVRPLGASRSPRDVEPSLLAALLHGRGELHAHLERTRLEEELAAEPPPLVERPSELYTELRRSSAQALVIPHATSDGRAAPLGARVAAGEEPALEGLVELYSGHGNGEEYRTFHELRREADGGIGCPDPTDDYLPTCWRAGELARAECEAAREPAPECDRRAAVARNDAARGRLPELESARAPAAWLDAGQCKDCFLPSFDHRPASAVQTRLAEGGARFGFVAGGASHSARPGAGYKERWRLGNTDSRRADGDLELARAQSFRSTGGLVAAHAAQRSRDSLWQAFEKRAVYATSGERILLWFELVNDPNRPVPMGGEASLDSAPRFAVHAIGARAQSPGCPDSSHAALAPERLEALCRGECWNPSGPRQPIARIEVVRIRPRAAPDEDLAGLVEDPWRVFACPDDSAGCAFEFEDREFARSRRPALYYVRALQKPSPAVNGANLRCEYDGDGGCLSVAPCGADSRTAPDDDCLARIEERAWSSPIWIDRAD